MLIGICARTWAEQGGIGVYTRNVIPRLVQQDSTNSYVIFYSEDDYVGQFREYDNVQEVAVPLATGMVIGEIATLVWDQITMPRFAKKYGLDVILHTKMSVPLFASCKTAMVLHGTERFYYPEFQNLADELFLKMLNRRFWRRADLIIADAENARKDIIEHGGVDPTKVHVAHLAGDDEFHVIKDCDRLASIKEKYGLPDRFLVFVGHIYPGKNIGRLLQAFAAVRKSIDIDLVLVGGMRRKYKTDLAEIESLGLTDSVHLTGFVPIEDLVCLYNLAEATVFPSIYECFPAIPLDAGACGCPVITSNTGGTPESAGDAAEYVDPFDVDDIERGVKKVLTDDIWREELIRRGHINSERFSWEKTAEQTIRALNSLAAD